jgi:hypothetical protein
VAKARGRLAISKALSEGLSMKAAEVIWWSMIVPVLNFGSELWGAAKCNEVEMVQLEVGRRLLGVSKKMTSAVARGELGWWSMRAQRDMRLLIYWARLVRLDDGRLVKQVYRSRREQAEKRISDWCSHVHRTLLSIGLGHIWDNEQVGNEKDWKDLLKARIQAREEKEWIEEMTQLPKLRTYRKLKSVLKKEEYLATITGREERRRMTALRGGTNPSRIETGRWKGELVQDRTCTLCAEGEVEDEVHVLLCCSTYERERRELYRNIQRYTNIDIKAMMSDKDRVLQVLIGVGCSQRRNRLYIHSEVGKFIAVMFRSRARLLEQI